MAGNLEVLLHRIAGVIKEKYKDEELSGYLSRLNDVFLNDDHLVKYEKSIGVISREFYIEYLKEWDDK